MQKENHKFCRLALENEIKNRARIYVHIYQGLCREAGSERAKEILMQALYARGKEKGADLAAKIPKPDLDRLAQVFVQSGGEIDVFGHEIVGKQERAVLLRLKRCPLVEAWNEAKLSQHEKQQMCDIACQVDFGKFESAGYKIKFQRRISRGESSCDLYVTPATAKD